MFANIVSTFLGERFLMTPVALTAGVQLFQYDSLQGIKIVVKLSFRNFGIVLEKCSAWLTPKSNIAEICEDAIQYISCDKIVPKLSI
jgi:hypothetical protein